MNLVYHYGFLPTIVFLFTWDIGIVPEGNDVVDPIRGVGGI